MSTTPEILNLNTICRCCHRDGSFKGLRVPYVYENQYEIYSEILKETLNIDIDPPLIEASYSICEECVERLRDASNFKKQVLICEMKFAEYCKNELVMGTQSESELRIRLQQMKNTDVEVKFEIDGIKSECNDNDDNNFEDGNISDVKENDDIKTEIKEDIKNEPQTEEDKETVKKKKIKKKSNSRQQAFDASLVVEVQTQSNMSYSCKICQGSYNTMKLIKQHIIKNHSKREYICKDCDGKYASLTAYKNHRRYDHMIHYCKFCPREFKTGYALRYHVNSHTKSVIYKCDYCGKEFLYRSSIKSHVKGHLGIKKKCICDVCGHAFNDATNLRIHIQTVHEKLKPYHCNFCSKSFAAKKGLVSHIRRHTGEKPFQCGKCLEYFYTRFDSNNHRNCGVTERVYKCKVCGKEFDRRGSFAAHSRRSHTSNKPHICSECGKAFASQYVMKRHLLSHAGIKPFSCNLCPRKFTQKAAADRHVRRIHNPERLVKKNECGICKRVVLDLEKHNSKCHGDLKFACDLCDKSYAQKTALNRHKRVIHMGLYFKCELCNKQYHQKNKLVKHQAKAHNITVKSETDIEESVASY